MSALCSNRRITLPQQDTRITNQVTVRTVSGELVEVDVNDLSDALTRELTSLRLELSSIRDEREQELRQVKTHTIRVGHNYVVPLMKSSFKRLN